MCGGVYLCVCVCVCVYACVCVCVCVCVVVVGDPQPRWQKVYVQTPPPQLDQCKRRIHRPLKYLAQVLANLVAFASAGDEGALGRVTRSTA